MVAHTAQYLLWIVSWAVLGQLSFQGHFDTGWRLGWALMLLTMIPLQLLTTWKQGQLVIGFGGLLKRRLLYGAMQLGPEEMRHGGIGRYMSQALEAESVESLALSGGVQGALAVIELVVAGFLLGSMALVLALWFALACVAGWRFFRRYHAWTGARLGITDHLVEAMVGQRTRLVQQRQADWHAGEDDALKNYLGISRTLDRMENWLTMAVPRGWLFCALLCFAPSMFQGGQQPAQVAVTFGGILLAYTGFRRLTGSAADIAIFFESVRRIRALFQAAARRESSGAALRQWKCDTHSREGDRSGGSQLSLSALRRSGIAGLQFNNSSRRSRSTARTFGWREDDAGFAPVGHAHAGTGIAIGYGIGSACAGAGPMAETNCDGSAVP